MDHSFLVEPLPVCRKAVCSGCIHANQNLMKSLQYRDRLVRDLASHEEFN
jgi:hypothetical protein